MNKTKEEWEQLIYSRQNGVNGLIWDMAEMSFPELNSLISSNVNFIKRQNDMISFMKPCWLSDRNKFDTYGRLFTIISCFKIGTGQNEILKVMLEDVDDGDNSWIYEDKLNFENVQQQVINIFGKTEILDCENFEKTIKSLGFKSEKQLYRGELK